MKRPFPLTPKLHVMFDEDDDLFIGRKDAPDDIGFRVAVYLPIEEAAALRDWLNNNSPSARIDATEPS